ncbi:MAG: glycosyltransferase [Candidatus Margulisbacteria bacterium]|nr:glycosyltransferase [Candidatus Margulisiibacteriota bacterium]MBU1617146.1 glycosyltransferase [Candidatus Margulisiibacteriota bacterium]
MKNILFLEQFSFLGGGQKVLLKLIKGLDYRSWVIIPGEGDFSRALTGIGAQPIVAPIGQYSTGRKSLIDFVKYLFLSIIMVFFSIYIIKKNQINIVYANAPRTFLWGALAAKICGIPVIWHLHSNLKGVELRLSRFLAKHWVDKLIAVSNFTSNVFNNGDPILLAKTSVVYNGIDPREYDQVAVSDLHKTYNLQGKKVITFIGRITPLKGIKTLIEAADIIKNEGQLAYLIVGEPAPGDRKDVEYRGKLVDFVGKHKLTDRVLFVGQRNDIPSILKMTDILVLPSVEPEACPLVILEAIAAGKNVITTDIGGQAELAKEGLLFPPGDAQKLADLIILGINTKVGRESGAVETRTSFQQKIAETIASLI